jgi:alkylhydroperoxidase family enzyme
MRAASDRIVTAASGSRLDVNLPRSDHSPMFIPHFKHATPQAEGQSDLRRLFAYDPDRSKYLLEFTQATMRSAGPLSPGERELLAAMTSRENACLF